MSDNSRDGERETPPDEAALSARLKRLGERLEQSNTSRSSAGSASRRVGDPSAFSRRFRRAPGLAAGGLGGAGRCWAIGKGLGHLPWGVFVLALPGFAAGVWNLMRPAGVSPGGVPDSTIERRDN